jgi:hypothetical protein
MNALGTKALSPKNTEAHPRKISDSLDSKYAHEVLNRLPKILDRATQLDVISIARMPNKSVRDYFEEAHNCYLYGFNNACLVLCRAILESALKERLTPAERSGKSVVGMIHAAKANGLITADRAVWAEDVDRAGSTAIHNYSQSQKHYSAHAISDVLTKTRAVVEQLYSGVEDVKDAASMGH